METLAFQASLLDSAPTVEVGSLGTAVRRRRLARGAWVDVLPRWVVGADVLFERLRGGVPWRAQRRSMYDRVVDVPRLLAFYDEEAPLPDPALDAARVALDEHYAAELGEPAGHSWHAAPAADHGSVIFFDRRSTWSSVLMTDPDAGTCATTCQFRSQTSRRPWPVASSSARL